MDFEKQQELDPSQAKLDDEYRQILRIIKPYIQTINNNTYLAQYRIWLEKLSEAKENEKFVRNQYLMELARQIQCKHLAAPFIHSPPLGNLPPLNGQPWNYEEPFHTPLDQPLDVFDPYVNKQMMCQQWTEENECNISMSKPQWPFHSTSPRPRRPSSTQHLLSSDQQLREAQRCVKRSASSVKKFSLLKGIEQQSHETFAEGITPPAPSRSPTRPLRAPPTPVPPPPPVPKDPRLELDAKKRHQPHGPQTSSLGVILEDKNDVNECESWCDLSDTSNVSLAVLGSGDTEQRKEMARVNQQGDHFEKKINTLMIEINGLKRKSERVNERCEHTLRTVQERLPNEAPLKTPEQPKVRKMH